MKRNNKKIQETKWRVSLTTSMPNVQNIEKIMDAPDQAEAIRRASTQFPNQKFSQVNAQQLDPQTNAPTAQAQQMTQTMMGQPRPRPGISGPTRQANESIDLKRISYPYSITLPSAFACVITESSPVAVAEGNGQYHITLTNAKGMRKLLENLKKHQDKNIAKEIFKGIRSSI
jgi:hypothetical protein